MINIWKNIYLTIYLIIAIIYHLCVCERERHINEMVHSLVPFSFILGSTTYCLSENGDTQWFSKVTHNTSISQYIGQDHKPQKSDFPENLQWTDTLWNVFLLCIKGVALHLMTTGVSVQSEKCTSLGVFLNH